MAWDVSAARLEILDDNMTAADIKDKLELMGVNAGNHQWLRKTAGALGSINSFKENPGLPDRRQWIIFAGIRNIVEEIER